MLPRSFINNLHVVGEDIATTLDMTSMTVSNAKLIVRIPIIPVTTHIEGESLRHLNEANEVRAPWAILIKFVNISSHRVHIEDREEIITHILSTTWRRVATSSGVGWIHTSPFSSCVGSAGPELTSERVSGVVYFSSV